MILLAIKRLRAKNSGIKNRQGVEMLSEQKLITAQGQRVAVVTGLRTPFNKQDTGFKQIFAADLGTMVTNELLNRFPVERRLIQV